MLQADCTVFHVDPSTLKRVLAYCAKYEDIISLIVPYENVWWDEIQRQFLLHASAPVMFLDQVKHT